MSEGMLFIAVVGVATYAAAEGRWAGEVRIPGPFLVGLARMPPFEDPVVVGVRDGRLYVGSVSVGCVEQDAWKSKIQLPLDSSLPEIPQARVPVPGRADREGRPEEAGRGGERTGGGPSLQGSYDTRPAPPHAEGPPRPTRQKPQGLKQPTANAPPLASGQCSNWSSDASSGVSREHSEIHLPGNLGPDLRLKSHGFQGGTVRYDGE